MDFKALVASLCVRCKLCEIENGMGGAKGFARRHRGISRIWLLLSVSVVNFVRLKTVWEVQRVSLGDTEGTEAFQNFVCSFSLCPL